MSGCTLILFQRLQTHPVPKSFKNRKFAAILEKPATYRSIRNPSVSEFKERKSKFIGLTAFCRTEEAVKRQLSEWRNEYSNASHVCYAFRLGTDKKQYRASDDGEPANSAGAPIFGQIQSFDLTNILVAVVRYYGGVKLGVGGLIGAYRTAAREAIEAGTIETIEVLSYIRIHFDYAQMPFVMQFIKQNALISSGQDFALDCKIKVALPVNSEDSLLAELDANPALRIEKLEAD